jgi:hypothetical protein
MDVYVPRHADVDAIPTNIETELHASWVFREKQILIEALEKFLDTWDREFGYHDRQASKMRWLNA